MHDEHLPQLSKDRAFWGMTATQFLGAFNDNVFKQLVLLLSVDYMLVHKLTSDPYQTTALAVFALPFVLLSGFAGWLSDRVSKRRVIILAKVAEIVVMALGFLAFVSADQGTEALMTYLLLVLLVMSVQSAFFGPSKYGVLPEMFRDRDLPAVNGTVQMTTFLAIVFGQAFCGFGKQMLEGAGYGLWLMSLFCVAVAVLGTLTSFLLRPTEVVDPDLPFKASALAVDGRTWRMVRDDGALFLALMISSHFWFAAGMVQPAVNAFGKQQIGLDDFQTSLMLAGVGFGIAVGCVVAGRLCGHKINFGIARIGAWGIVLTCAGLAAVPAVTETQASAHWMTSALLLVMGVSAGFFAVPLQVLMQARPPAGQKGRMMGAMNLFNWLGILLSAVGYGICSKLFVEPPATEGADPVSHIGWTFAVVAGLMLPVALFYRPRDEELS
ncbi:MAG: MFS transporter [Planctomycetaceae bacterium]|nr:MFS transporter [Planctomycetaceae bacterium]